MVAAGSRTGWKVGHAYDVPCLPYKKCSVAHGCHEIILYDDINMF
jgi:hypothetical protein